MYHKQTYTFVQQYNASIEKSYTKYQRPQPCSIMSSDDISSTILHTDIPMVEIVMPEDRFHALLENEAKIKRLANIAAGNDNSADMFDTMLNEFTEETRSRNASPAAKKAYDHYRTILHLSK